MEDISKKIKKHRKILDITQEQLAERMDINKKTIIRYESGECKPEYEMIPKLAKALKVNEEYLFNDNSDSDLEKTKEQLKKANKDFDNLLQQISEYEKKHSEEDIESKKMYILLVAKKEKLKLEISYLSEKQAILKGQRIHDN